MVQTEISTSAHHELPPIVRKRTNALRNLQLKAADIEAKMSEEMHKLECKYAKLFEPIYDQREKIVNGEYEPTDEETTWNYETNDLDENETNGNANKKQKTEAGSSSSSSANDVRGVPNFWLNCLRTNIIIAGMITDLDEPILKQLRDVRIKLNDAVLGYTIEFHFNENEYFTNKVLSKSFELNTKKSNDNPLTGEVTPLAKSVGTKIEWREGKNVIEKLRQEQTKAGGKSKDADDNDSVMSFFSLFDTLTEDGVNPLIAGKINPANIGELDHIIQQFELEYEVSQVLKDVIVPKAVLYFTGELGDEEDMDDFGDEDDDDDDDDEDDDDDDDDDEDDEPVPRKKKGGK